MWRRQRSPLVRLHQEFTACRLLGCLVFQRGGAEAEAQAHVLWRRANFLGKVGHPGATQQFPKLDSAWFAGSICSVGLPDGRYGLVKIVEPSLSSSSDRVKLHWYVDTFDQRPRHLNELALQLSDRPEMRDERLTWDQFASQEPEFVQIAKGAYPGVGR